MSDNNPTVDQVAVDDGENTASADDGKIEKNLKSKSTWLRLVFMFIYAVLIGIVGMVGGFVVVLGFLWVLFTGEINRQLQQVGRSIASYIAEITLYLTYNTEQKPFPLGGEWPSGVPDHGPDQL